MPLKLAFLTAITYDMFSVYSHFLSTCGIPDSTTSGPFHIALIKIDSWHFCSETMLKTHLKTSPNQKSWHLTGIFSNWFKPEAKWARPLLQEKIGTNNLCHTNHIMNLQKGHQNSLTQNGLHRPKFPVNQLDPVAAGIISKGKSTHVPILRSTARRITMGKVKNSRCIASTCINSGCKTIKSTVQPMNNNARSVNVTLRFW